MISLLPSLSSFHSGPPTPTPHSHPAPAHIVTPPPTTHCLSIQYWAEGMPYFLQPETQGSEKEVRVRLAASSIELRLRFLSKVHRGTAEVFSGWQKKQRHSCFYACVVFQRVLTVLSVETAAYIRRHLFIFVVRLLIAPLLFLALTRKSAHLQDARRACHRAPRRQTRPVTGSSREARPRFGD